MEIPTTQGIVELHAFILERTGGTPGILHRSTITSAIERLEWGPFLDPPDLADRAALLLRGICQDHPFADGNKRTAFESADAFLTGNGAPLDVEPDAVVAFMTAVAQAQLTVPAIAAWLRAHMGKPKPLQGA